MRVQRLLQAWHEAAHAVAHHYLIGDLVSKIELGDEPKCVARSRGKRTPTKEAMTLYAGVAAEMIWQVQQYGEFSNAPTGSGSDFPQADALLPSSEARSRCFKQTINFIASHLSEVEAVAGALMKRGKLSGPQFYAALLSAGAK